jgi:hypothetical protein
VGPRLNTARSCRAEQFATNERVGNVEGSVTKLEQTVTALGSDVTALKGTVTAQGAAAAELKGTVTAQGAAVAELKGTVTALAQKAPKLYNKKLSVGEQAIIARLDDKYFEDLQNSRPHGEVTLIRPGKLQRGGVPTKHTFVVARALGLGSEDDRKTIEAGMSPATRSNQARPDVFLYEEKVKMIKIENAERQGAKLSLAGLDKLVSNQVTELVQTTRSLLGSLRRKTGIGGEDHEEDETVPVLEFDEVLPTPRLLLLTLDDVDTADKQEAVKQRITNEVQAWLARSLAALAIKGGAHSVVGGLDTFLDRVRSWAKCVRAAQAGADDCLKVTDDIALKAGFFKIAEVAEDLPTALAKIVRSMLEDAVILALRNSNRCGNFPQDVGGAIGKIPDRSTWRPGVYITFLYRVALKNKRVAT